MLSAFRRIFVSLRSRSCGNCGKLGVLWTESFPSPVGTVEKSLFIFPRFPQDGSFHSLPPLDGAARIDLGNPMSTKIDLPDPISQGRPQRHRVSPKSFAEPKDPVVTGNLAVVLNLA